MKEKRFYIGAPPNIITGGVELAHQMCCELRRNGHQAWMYYMVDAHKEPVDIPADARYEKYGTSHADQIDAIESEEAVVIMPEGWPLRCLELKRCKKVFWWMSVDNYLRAVQCLGEDYLDVLKKEVSLHLVQSQYAHQYLLKRGVPPEKILWVSDYISENYGAFQLPPELRQNIVLYNPKKGYEEIKPLIEKVDWLRWIPLINLTEEQMVTAMELAKVYVDFGEHPGKDRIPREAASCGCCVITNRKGSAAFYEDIPIPDCYKIDDVSMSYDRVEALLKDICIHWEEHSRQFDVYRKMISCEKQNFSEAVRRFTDKVLGRI